MTYRVFDGLLVEHTGVQGGKPAFRMHFQHFHVQLDADEGLAMVCALCNLMGYWDTFKLTVPQVPTPEDIKLASYYKAIQQKLQKAVDHESSHLEKEVARMIASYLSIDLMEDDPFDHDMG